MKNALILAATAETAAGLGLLIVPSLVGQLLLGEALTGVAGQLDSPVLLSAVERFERATTAAKVPRSTLALTEQQVQSAMARAVTRP
jgi:hypothetical protein